MPKRTSYAQGTPSWVDLQTSDPGLGQGLLRTRLFGWELR